MTDPIFNFGLSDLSIHLYMVQIDFQNLRKTRIAMMQELRDNSVGLQVLYIAAYLQPWHRCNYGYAASKCEVPQQFYQQALTLPLFPGTSNGERSQIISAVCAAA
jgi:perosamine synthetase